jgi:hypothetical protein
VADTTLRCTKKFPLDGALRFFHLQLGFSSGQSHGLCCIDRAGSARRAQQRVRGPGKKGVRRDLSFREAGASSVDVIASLGMFVIPA